MGKAGLDSYKISIVGQFQILFNNQPLSIKSAKAQALAACVCLNTKKAVSREVLATLLWDSSDESRARMSLRQTLRSLLLSFPANAERPFAAEGQEVRLLLPKDSIDYFDMLRKIEAGKVPELLLRGKEGASDLLAGLDGLATEFDRFLLTERTIFSDQLSGRLEKLVRASETDRFVRFAAAKALLNNDQTNEFACRAVMQHLAEEGETAAAIRTFETLQEILDNEYDVEPSVESVDLNAKIKMGELEPQSIRSLQPAFQPAPQLAQEASLPVIAMKSIELGHEEMETAMIFRAFNSDLLAVLIRFREWFVTDGTALKDGFSDYSLEMQLQPGEVAPTALVILKNQRNGRYLWSESVQLLFDTWRNSHHLIAQRIASAIDLTISAHKLSELDRQFPSTKSSFERWIYCRNLIEIWRPERFNEAIEILNKIVEEDPDFAQGHSEIAALHNSRHLFMPGQFWTQEVSEISTRHSELAIKLDPLDAKANRVFAWSSLMDGNYDTAILYFERAVELNKSDPLTLLSSAQGLSFCGEYSRSLDLASRSLQLQSEPPQFLRGYFVGINFLAGRYREAIEASRKSAGGITNLYGWEAVALLVLGEVEPAKTACKKFLELTRKSWAGSSEPTDSAIADWFAQSFPIRDTRARDYVNQNLIRLIGMVNRQ